MSYIYLLHQIIFNNFKIGSTQDYNKRLPSYKTCCDNFDNKTHLIIIYEIKKSKYSCYQIDDIINKTSTKINFPFVKYNGTGGTEFYEKNDYNNLSNFFDLLEIKYNKFQLNIDEFNKNKITKKEIREIEEIDEINFKSIDDVELNIILNKIKYNQFSLKIYQQEAFNIFKNYKNRFQHLITSPTGTGKTVIFTLFICFHIINNKKDVIIFTKRKDILEDMKLRLKSYIDKFIQNNIIKSFDYEIIDCLNDCSTTILNNVNNKPTIYIINWDKITSSNKTDYKKINWNKFGFIVIDESHWVGSNKIFQFMNYINNNTNIDYIGLSATPIRLTYKNQSNIINIFGNKKDYNILYNYPYYEALENKFICPVKYVIIKINENDLINNNENKIISKKSYKNIWKQIKETIIDKTHFKKGILWFNNRTNLLLFYNKMLDKIKDFTLLPTFSFSKNNDNEINSLIKKNNLNENDINNNVKNFKNTDNNVILLSVFRAIEGFDDHRIEFGIKMYFSMKNEPLNESQKMGRLCRWFENNPNGIKKCGYYGSIELFNNPEDIKKSLIMRFRSWIKFIELNTKISSNENKDKQNIKNKVKLLFHKFFDVETLNFYNIDLEKDIIDNLKYKTFDKHKIKNLLIVENNNNNIINTKSKYDAWAFNNNFPSCDELIELKFNDFKWLFNIKDNDFLSWKELKKLCKKYQSENSDIKSSDLYEIIIKENHNVPPEPDEFYKNKFTSFNDLFN